MAVARWTLQDLVFIKGVGKGKTLGLERGGTSKKLGKSSLNFSRPLVEGVPQRVNLYYFI